MITPNLPMLDDSVSRHSFARTCWGAGLALAAIDLGPLLDLCVMGLAAEGLKLVTVERFGTLGVGLDESQGDGRSRLLNKVKA
jgi:hypothetical protein